jgi:hypothetical protein
VTEPIFSPVRLAVAVVCCLLVALPFLVVRYPPITDLPQHVAQVRLFGETLGQAQAPYRIQWFTPYSLVYLLLGGAWMVFPAEDAGRMAVLFLAVVSTLAVHFLAAARGRPLVTAVLVSALFFNHVVYWGFLSFAMGWVAFTVWFLVTTSRPKDSFSARDAALLLGAAALLYLSHALWFAVGIVWLGLHALLARLSPRGWVLRFASVAPLLLMAALWYPQLATAGFVSPTLWTANPLERLSPFWLVDAILGGLHGVAEPLLLLALAGWTALSLLRSDRRSGGRADRELLAAGVSFACLALLLPDMYMNTIRFASRWLPAAAIVLVLALPAPSLARRSLCSLALVLLAVYCVATAVAWKRFENDELAGLREAVAGVPLGQRVVGLDYVKESAIVKGRPFLQNFAYAQVVRGASLNFSFAGFAPSLVVYRESFRKPWTVSLEWFAERLERSDLQYFDYAILNGAERVHRTFSAQPELQPQTHAGRWRLYRVNPDVAANGPNRSMEGSR